MKTYVLGFAFYPLDHVVLIRKTKPTWQAGRLNGVGGKVEDTDSTRAQAMSREFKEETGLLIPSNDWQLFTAMWFHSDHGNGTDVTVYCYATKIQDARVRVETTTDEVVCVYPADDLPEDVLPNLRWLVPMARQALDGALVPNRLVHDR